MDGCESASLEIDDLLLPPPPGKAVDGCEIHFAPPFRHPGMILQMPTHVMVSHSFKVVRTDFVPSLETDTRSSSRKKVPGREDPGVGQLLKKLCGWYRSWQLSCQAFVLKNRPGKNNHGVGKRSKRSFVLSTLFPTMEVDIRVVGIALWLNVVRVC